MAGGHRRRVSGPVILWYHVSMWNRTRRKTKYDAETSRMAFAAMLRTATQERARAVYLVVTENGILSARFDRNRALEMARNVDAVVATVPILIDFRGTEIVEDDNGE